MNILLKGFINKMQLFKIFKNRKVLITGHTGFKGSWLTLWLQSLGANIMGISNNIVTEPSHFEAIGLKKKIKNKIVDINNLKQVKKIIKQFRPSFIFHLAAQALVRKSYIDPIDTIKTNTIGTLNILESARYLKNDCNVILITSDKVYRNLEIQRGYNENDIMGGKDPYSASKAAAENIIYSYINSYFNKKNSHSVCIARAGNVIGGGDWSDDRIIPDCIKSWSKNKVAIVRNPNSTRPWQHVLEAVGGYLILASKLKKNKKLHSNAFNFGPSKKNNYKVIDLIKNIKKNWKNIRYKNLQSKKNLFESKLLKLNSQKAYKLIKWRSILNFNETTKLVSEWYKNYYFSKMSPKEISLGQIMFYQRLLRERLKLK